MSTPTPPDGAQRLDTGGPAASEPVLLAHAVTLILAAAVGTGWVTIPDTRINAVGTAVAAVLSTIGVLAARARVSPSGRITWAGVRQVLQGLLYDELDRLAALPAAPPAPAPAPVPAGVPASAAAPAALGAAGGNLASLASAPLASFTTSAAFAPAPPAPPADNTVTAIQPVVPPTPQP